MKKDNRVEKIIGIMYNEKSTVDCSSDLSDNQEYEDDFEVKIKIKIKIDFFLIINKHYLRIMNLILSPILRLNHHHLNHHHKIIRKLNNQFQITQVLSLRCPCVWKKNWNLSWTKSLKLTRWNKLLKWV